MEVSIMIGTVALMYLLPAIVACWRGHQNSAAITCLVLFLGWTGLGWILSLVWSLTEVRAR